MKPGFKVFLTVPDDPHSMRLTYFYPDLDKEDKRGTPVQVVPLELDGVLSQMLTGLAHLNGCMPEDEIGELFVSMFEAGKNAGT